jgi:hypothetical protein
MTSFLCFAKTQNTTATGHGQDRGLNQKTMDGLQGQENKIRDKGQMVGKQMESRQPTIPDGTNTRIWMKNLTHHEINNILEVEVVGSSRPPHLDVQLVQHPVNVLTLVTDGYIIATEKQYIMIN